MKEKERKGERGEEEKQGREGDCKEKKNELQLVSAFQRVGCSFCFIL